MNELTLIFRDAFDFILIILPIFIPFILVWSGVRFWIDYARAKHLSEREHLVLDILPPQDIDKSPAAMELFLGALWQIGGESTWIDRYIKGKRRAWFSLEIASIGGNVHFYIWTQSSFKSLIESQLYAQYPGIEVKEVEDYAQKFDFEPGKTDIFAAEFELMAPDPYPIKTYIDYGLESGVKEEEKIDPITPVIEALANIGKGQQMWMQIIVKAHKKEDKDPKHWFKKTDNWVDTALAEIQKIRKESITEVEVNGEKQRLPGQTEGQKKKISALERSISKISFDAGIRTIYMADSDSFDGANIPAMLGSMKQYSSADLNGLKPGYFTSFNYPWEDFGDRRLNKVKHEILDAYKERAYFFKPQPGLFKNKNRNSMILNTEELATIYHFPGRVSGTPTLGRVQSRKGTAPHDLPI